jgi:hypothetical protein
MPKPNELPDGLKDFAFRQAAGVATEHFHSNMDKVIASIDRHLTNLRSSRETAKPELTSQETKPEKLIEEKPSGQSAKIEPQGATARRLRAEVEQSLGTVSKEKSDLPTLLAAVVAPLFLVPAIIWAMLKLFFG